MRSKRMVCSSFMAFSSASRSAIFCLAASCSISSALAGLGWQELRRRLPRVPRSDPPARSARRAWELWFRQFAVSGLPRSRSDRSLAWSRLIVGSGCGVVIAVVRVCVLSVAARPDLRWHRRFCMSVLGVRTLRGVLGGTAVFLGGERAEVAVVLGGQVGLVVVVGIVAPRCRAGFLRGWQLVLPGDEGVSGRRRIPRRVRSRRSIRGCRPRRPRGIRPGRATGPRRRSVLR